MYADLPSARYHADVFWMAFFDFVYGDVVRRSSLCGAIKWDWWDEFSQDLEMTLYYPKHQAMALRGYVAGLRGVSLTRIQVPIAGAIIWCIDLCSGLQSRRDACMSLLREHVGTSTCRCVALDVAPLLVAGDKMHRATRPGGDSLKFSLTFVRVGVANPQ